MSTLIAVVLIFGGYLLAWLFFTALGESFWGGIGWLVATYLLPSFGYHISLEWWQWLLAGSIFQVFVATIKNLTTVKIEEK